MNVIIKTIIAGFVWILSTTSVYANEVSDFLAKVAVKTFDCPNDSDVPALENFLSRADIVETDRLNLLVYKAHWLICVGKNDQAKSILDAIIDEGNIDLTSHSYASLMYQLGFIFDVNDNPKRCEYYRQSEQLARDKFNDIHLSSQLGLITVCDQEQQSIGVKLGRLFALVKMYSAKKDVESLAHIHNNIGLLYSSIGQNALAAEQYEKSYRLGLTVYEEKISWRHSSVLLLPIVAVVITKMRY
ncbi:hypothetical protein RS130_17610 [Paraglaciecola aquimarina]|uniref:Tetratricopeptide repeat protein n=1 Tax=Paraglaciecola aquimarina TaxID=1235557 RepID=A0ABU3SZQ4_9ALTE|nr:hypothetical protein [Paraglaciecola aquimarina]MDU0355476.1 hypothetical protein [Paraglaciecola aquimarina]